MTFTLSPASINKICPNKEIMVYGFDHCHYLKVTRFFENHGVEVYTYELGYDLDNSGVKKIYQIRSGYQEGCERRHQKLRRICKSGLVNMVLENLKSQKIGKPLVPIIFCVDRDQNPYPLSSGKIISRNTDIVTYSELRRAYKLCNDPTIHPEVREIAKQSFKFVKVGIKGINPNLSISFTPVSPPWETKDWYENWFVQRGVLGDYSASQKPWKREIHEFRLQQTHESCSLRFIPSKL